MSERQDSAATQEKIMDAMLRLARKTPLGHITVRDICLACQISRKTFYTYFPNKYELLREIFRRKMSRPLVETTGRPDKEIKEEFIRKIVEWASFLKDNSAFIRSTYDTDQWSALERILLNSSADVVTRQVERYLEGKAPVTPRMKRMLWFYTCGEQGLLLRWIVEKRKETAEEIVQTILDSIPFELLKWYRDSGQSIDVLHDRDIEARADYRGMREKGAPE